MKFLSILLVQAALAIYLSSASPILDSRATDGIFLIATHLNGTIETTKLSIPNTLNTRSPIPTAKYIPRSPTSNTPKLNKRSTSCWKQPLNPSSVDKAVYRLKQWAGPYGNFIASLADQRLAIVTVSDAVKVFYCINAFARSGNLDIADIDYALWNMDQRCARYSSSSFRWDESVEIVGMAGIDTSVCMG